MNTSLYFKGSVKFASVKKLDKYGRYSITLILDKDDLPKFVKSGIQKSLKATPDGQVITFTRKAVYLDKKTNKPVELGAPKVVDKNGEETDYFVQSDEPVVCKVAIYDTEKGKGSSLESVMLLNREGIFADRKRTEDPDYDGVRF